MSNSMYGMYSPFNQQYGGMMGYGGGYPSMSGYGGYNPYSGYGGLFGGYNPYSGYGGYGSGYGYDQQPFYGYMGQQPQQQFNGFFDQFDTRMNDLFKQYFSPKDSGATSGGGSVNTAPPAGGSIADPGQPAGWSGGMPQVMPTGSKLPSDSRGAVYTGGQMKPGTEINVDKAYAQTNQGANFGQKYGQTGQFGPEGLKQIQAMGYKDQADYLANNENGQALAKRYANNPANQTSAANVSPRGAGGRNAPRMK